MEATTPKQAIHTDDAPTPTGPFSQAVRVGDLVFTAGQAGRNRDTGRMGDLAEQTEWALRNLDAILTAAGSSLAEAVKVTIYLKEGCDAKELNAVYERLLPEPRPARSSVFVHALKNPEMLVEMEVIAVARRGR